MNLCQYTITFEIADNTDDDEQLDILDDLDSYNLPAHLQIFLRNWVIRRKLPIKKVTIDG